MTRREIEILIEPSDTRITRPEELRWLVDEMRSLDRRNYDVALAYEEGEPRRYGGGFWEEVNVWLPAALGSAAINQIARLMVDWMKERFSEKPDNRKAVRIMKHEGENGEVIEIIEVTDPHKAAEYKVPDESEQCPRRKPRRK